MSSDPNRELIQTLNQLSAKAKMELVSFLQPWFPQGKGGAVEWEDVGAGGGGSGCGPLIYVGTPTQTAAQVDILGNSIPDLIAGNPSPFNADPWIPFENGWSNSLGTNGPVCFFSFFCTVFLLGGFSGGTASTTIFTLPTGYRPPYRLPLQCVFSAVTATEGFVVNADGTVVDYGVLP